MSQVLLQPNPLTNVSHCQYVQHVQGQHHVMTHHDKKNRKINEDTVADSVVCNLINNILKKLQTLHLELKGMTAKSSLSARYLV